MSSLEKRVADLEAELKEKNRQVKDLIGKLKFLTVGYILSKPMPVEDAPKDGRQVLFTGVDGYSITLNYHQKTNQWIGLREEFSPSHSLFCQVLIDPRENDSRAATSDSD